MALPSYSLVQPSVTFERVQVSRVTGGVGGEDLAPSASSAAPRPVASLSDAQWIGRPSASASMRVQCREWLMAPPDATTR